MLIVGAGGLFLQMVDDLENSFNDIILWADSPVNNGQVLSKFEIISNEQQVLSQFSKDNRFIIAIGNPSLREKMAQKFISYGGQLVSFISSKATVSKYASIQNGCVILHGVIIEAGVGLGKGCLINTAAVLTHECQLGDFVEMGPGAVLAGQVKISNNVFVGSSATILPKISIGSNAIVGAASLVMADVASGTTVVGIPAKPLIK